MDLYNLVLSAKITKGEGGGGGDEPTGTKEINITQNGVTTEDVKPYASAKITTSVPVGVFPSGTKQISSNGNFDVTNFASAAVNISPIIQSLSISENGTYSVPSGVDGYSPVTVNVSGGGGITPSGTYSITSNGIYDIVSFASVDVNVSGGGGGDHDAEDAIVARTISGAYENSRVTSVGGSAFNGCSSLTTVSFPNATSIGSYAFYSCTSLTTASFPSATSIGNHAFNNCTKLTTASFPNVTSIGNYAFNSCTSLTIASFPSATSIGSSAFNSCTSLTIASFPNATSIGQNAFNNCTSLTIASFPSATSIANNVFYSCSKLTTASFPLGESFGNQCFRSCTSLESLYVLASSVATLGISAFLSTPMSLSSYLGHFGSIYVPASLVDSYKSAPNWSAYADRITSYTE